MTDRLSEHFTWAEATRSSTADRRELLTRTRGGYKPGLHPGDAI